MTYRDDRAAIAQRIADLEAHLSGIRAARQSLTTLQTEEQSVISELDKLRQRTALPTSEIKHRLPMLDRIEIATPCNVPWDTMVGDDKTRFCSQCKLHVHNLSAMTRAEAESLVQCGTSICVRLYRRADGTVLTQDCPVALRRKARRRLAAAALISASVAASVLGALAAFHRVPASMMHAESKPEPRVMPFMGQAVIDPRIVPTPPTPPAPTVPDTRPHMGRAAYHTQGGIRASHLND